MNFPNLPTDSLYKFLAITGLSIILLASYFFFNAFKNIKQVSLIYNNEIELCSYDETDLENELSFIKGKARKICLQSNCNCFDKQGNMVLLPDVSASKDNILISKRKTIDSLLNKYMEKKTALNKKALQLQGKNKLLNNEHINFEIYSIWFLNFILIGLIMTISGFYFWYTRIQKFQDLMLKSESNKFKENYEKQMD